MNLSTCSVSQDGHHFAEQFIQTSRSRDEFAAEAHALESARSALGALSIPKLERAESTTSTAANVIALGTNPHSEGSGAYEWTAQATSGQHIVQMPADEALEMVERLSRWVDNPRVASPQYATNFKFFIRLRYLIDRAKLDESRTQPTQAAVAAAKAFARRLADGGFNVPRVMLDDGGEILLFGRRGRAYLDLGFQSDGKISYYGRNLAGADAFGDDLHASDELPPRLIQILRDIA